MPIEVLTRFYALLLVAEALLWMLLLSRAVWALYKNHLLKRVRVVIYGVVALALPMTFEQGLRAWGRMYQWMCGVLPTQSNPELALVALMLSTTGLLAFIVTVEMTTHFGTIPPKTDGK